MSSDSDSPILVLDEQPQGRLRFSITHAMIAVAAVAVVFAVLGVNRLAAIFIVAFVLSASRLETATMAGVVALVDRRDCCRAVRSTPGGRVYVRNANCNLSGTLASVQPS